MFKGPNWNKLMSTRQGSPEALGTDENRCLLNLGTQASQGNYTYIFLDWLGKERSCHWGLEICSDHFKVSGEPWHCLTQWDINKPRWGFWDTRYLGTKFGGMWNGDKSFVAVSIFLTCTSKAHAKHDHSMYVIPEQQQEQMWHTFTFLTDPTDLPRLKVSFWSQQLLKVTHASKLHMMQNGSRVSKSVSWKIEENSSFSTKPAPLKIKNDYSDRMLLGGGYITLCKCRIEVQEDTNYFQHQQQWWEQLFLIHGKSEFLWLMKVLNG